MKRPFWRAIAGFLDDFLAYVLTIIGIIASNYIPLLKKQGAINISIDWWRLTISAVVALMIISRQEVITAPDDQAKIKAREGRRKRFLLRMSNALAQGALWAQIMDMA